MVDVLIKVPYKRGDFSSNGFIGSQTTQSLISGLSVYRSITKETFYIQPLNSTGSETSMRLRLPCNYEMLTELIEALVALRDGTKPSGDEPIHE